MSKDTLSQPIQSLLGMELSDLERFVGAQNEPSYRGRQIYQWIYARRSNHFDQMTNLPQSLRERLAEVSIITLPKVISKQEATDGTVKVLFEIGGGDRVESVYIPEGARKTICLSSQVGCLVGCKFCATGLMGFRRNLTAGEIVGQLMALEAEIGEKMINVVMMGMGEPLLNRRAVFQATRLITDPDGIGMSRRRFTISTVGWLPGIEAMRAAGLRVKLAISMNGTTDEQRRSIMPLMTRYNLDDIIQSANRYATASKTRIALSYLLLEGVNDSDDDAKRLIKLSRRLPSKVNLMEYNDIGSSYRRTGTDQSERFLNLLREAYITVTLRTSRGDEIDGACGQLAGQYSPGSGKLLTVTDINI